MDSKLQILIVRRYNEKINKEIEKEQSTLDELNKESMLLNKYIEKGKKEIQELENKLKGQDGLLDRIRAERHKQRQNKVCKSI